MTGLLFEDTLEKGEIRIERRFDKTDPRRDATIIAIGGKLSSKKWVQVKALLEGKVIIRRKEGDRG